MASLSDSRFHMWRTVFALAHADGQVTDQERRFMQIYLSRLSTTPDQQMTLKKDIEQAQDVATMFAKISAEKDVEDFFNFARLLVWCDGDFGAQEKQIMEMLRQRQDTPLGTERILTKLQTNGLKKSDWLKKVHKSIDGLNDVFEAFSAVSESDTKSSKGGKGMGDSRFHMWRAVFAMAHADNVVTIEEKKYLNGILASEPFSDEQKRILEKDMVTAQDIADMFIKIDDQSDRSQFFYHARMLVWSDGDFGEQEQKIMMRLKQTHVRTVDFNQLINDLDLSLDEDQKSQIAEERGRILEEDVSEGFFRKLMRQVTGR